MTNAYSSRKADSTVSYYVMDSVCVQSLEVKYYTKDTIKFNFIQTSKNNGQTISLSGIADNEWGNSYTENEDEDRNSFDCWQYNNVDMEHACLLNIFIAFTQDKVIIDCDSCGVRKLGILRKK